MQADSESKRRQEEKLRRAAERRIERERELRDRLAGRLDRLDRRHREELRGLERAVAEQECRWRDELDRGLAREREHNHRLVEERIDEASRLFHEALDERDRVLREAIDTLGEDLARRELSEREVCATWRDLARDELGAIESSRLREVLAPGELERVRRGLPLADDSARRSMHQAAVAALQQVYLGARVLGDRLALLEAQWEHLHGCALETVEAARAELEQQARCELVLEGQSPFAVDVAHWSNGAWERLDAELRRVDEDLRADQPPDLETLRALALRGSELHARIDSVVDEARHAVLASIQRRQMQEAFLDKLQDLGYRLAGSTWEGDDQRRAIHMKLANPMGDEMAITVAPAATDDPLGSDVRVDFRDQSPNPTLRGRRVGVVQQVIQEEFEVQPGQFATEAGFETGNAPAARFDIDALRRDREPSR